MSPTADGPPDSLLTDLALARGPLHEHADLRGGADWWERAVAAGAAVVDVAGDTLAIKDSAAADPALAWREPREDDRDATVLLTITDRPLLARLGPATAAGDTALTSLRVVGAELAAVDAGAATTAVALAQWHARHTRCPRCGSATELSEAGWARTCLADGSVHFPRTDPAVIVLVRDDRDRALLGSRADWPDEWFSTLAGFVEAGESAEQTVCREVAEEAGVTVDPSRLRYRGSQPWPFPASLMLGFHAWAADSADPVPDANEIAQARWFSREDLHAQAAAGSVRIPPRVSIARKLIEDWFGGPLPGGWSRP